MKNRKFLKWLLSKRWLWKRVVFDNGVAGKNFIRYDHLILHYCEGMGENGYLGTKEDAIKNCIDRIFNTKPCGLISINKHPCDYRPSEKEVPNCSECEISIKSPMRIN